MIDLNVFMQFLTILLLIQLIVFMQKKLIQKRKSDEIL